MIKRIIGDAVLFAAIMFLAYQGQNILRVVQTKQAFEASPVTYSELIPDKEEYEAGELIGFTFERTCKTNPTSLPLLMLSADSFENLDTGEMFTATSLASRSVRRNGTERLRALRRLSPDCTPGTYSLEGWVNIQEAFATQAVLYSSRPFKVVKRNP